MEKLGRRTVFGLMRFNAFPSIIPIFSIDTACGWVWRMGHGQNCGLGAVNYIYYISKKRGGRESEYKRKQKKVRTNECINL